MSVSQGFEGRVEEWGMRGEESSGRTTGMMSSCIFCGRGMRFVRAAM